MMELFKLDGKVAIVTGCSSLEGIGYAIAEGLAEAGADIVGVDRNGLSHIKSAIETGTGKRFLEIQADLLEEESIDKIVETTKRVKYTLEVKLDRKDNKWEVNQLSDEDITKINGFYSN